jgi:hypothetical protein
VAVRGRRADLAEIADLRAELERHGPYLGLAEALRAEVERIANDPTADVTELAAAVDRWSHDARQAAVTAAFDGLPAEQRWALLARLFDDDELRAALAVEHQRAVAQARALVAGCLDTRRLRAGDELVVALFRAVDVRAVIGRGAEATNVARRLVLRVDAVPGRFLVIEDVFNPARGLYVTADYDEEIWRAERLAPYSDVAIGAARGAAGFEPIVYPGGRLDVETPDGVRAGRLHAGSVTVGGIELFPALPAKGAG